ncbi:efflux RND transporter periplasmic adaptor subunit [Candidatus Woesebacteria bacterium]|nr:efflux RND transporter periplasmic adaptor subunit [Candidatus Woesebacteria bacterium]
MKKKILLILIPVFWVVFLLLQSRNNQPVITFAQVKMGDIKSIVSASGTLKGKSTADMKFKTSGKLVYLSVKPGDKVYKGQLIAKLDDRDLSIVLQQAQNTLRDRQANVDNILDQVKGHGADETFSQKATRTTAEVARDNAYDSVRAAQIAIQNTALYSPLTGIVTNQDGIALGENITTIDLVAQVNDFSGFEFSSDIDEADIEKVKVGQKAEVLLDAYPDRKFEAEVNSIIPAIKTTTSGANVVSVKSLLKSTDINHIYGLSGQIDIVIDEKKSVSILPQDTLTDNNEVYIKKGSAFEKVAIGIGIKSDTDVEITSGLTTNDEVIINPQN